MSKLLPLNKNLSNRLQTHLHKSQKSLEGKVSVSLSCRWEQGCADSETVKATLSVKTKSWNLNPGLFNTWALTLYIMLKLQNMCMFACFYFFVCLLCFAVLLVLYFDGFLENTVLFSVWMNLFSFNALLIRVASGVLQD